MSKKEKEPEIIIEETGSIQDGKAIPDGQQVPEEKTISVADLLDTCVQMINHNIPNFLKYDDEELENFGVVIATVRRNIKAAVYVLREAQQKSKEAQENGQGNP